MYIPDLTWTPLFSHEDELNLKRSNLLTTLPVLPREWMVDFMFKPTNMTTRAFVNILHLTDKDRNTRSYGGRIPGVWLSSHGNFFIECSQNNTKNRAFNSGRPQVGKWTQISFIQENLSGKLRYRLLMDGLEKYNIENPQDKHFNNVRVYASDPWFNGQPGYIKNLSVKGKTQEALLEGKVE